MSETVQIKPFNLPQLMHRLEVINRRAEKIGVAPIEIEVGPLVEKEIPNRNDPLGIVTRFIQYHEVSILTDHTPRIEGFALVATIDFENGAVIINNNPSYSGELPVEFRSTDDRCDHCRTAHARKRVVVLEKDEEFIQVGSHCIKDFIGHDPSAILNFMSLMNRAIDEFDEISRMGSSKDDGVSTKQVIAVSLAVVAESGYTSRRRAEELDWEVTPTAVIVADKFISPSKWEEKKALAEWWKENVTDERLKEAEEIINWVQEQEANSDYFHNLIELTAMQSIGRKRIGIVASSVVAYNRAMNLLKKSEALPESNHVGEIGKRSEFKVKLTNLFLNDGFYGTTFIHSFRDEKGNDLTWFGTKDLGVEPSGSEFITIKGTVKKHDSYKGRKKTVINRVTLLD